MGYKRRRYGRKRRSRRRARKGYGLMKKISHYIKQDAAQDITCIYTNFDAQGITMTDMMGFDTTCGIAVDDAAQHYTICLNATDEIGFSANLEAINAAQRRGQDQKTLAIKMNAAFTNENEEANREVRVIIWTAWTNRSDLGNYAGHTANNILTLVDGVVRPQSLPKTSLAKADSTDVTGYINNTIPYKILKQWRFTLSDDRETKHIYWNYRRSVYSPLKVKYNHEDAYGTKSDIMNHTDAWGSLFAHAQNPYWSNIVSGGIFMTFIADNVGTDNQVFIKLNTKHTFIP